MHVVGIYFVDVITYSCIRISHKSTWFVFSHISDTVEIAVLTARRISRKESSTIGLLLVAIGFVYYYCISLYNNIWKTLSLINMQLVAACSIINIHFFQLVNQYIACEFVSSLFIYLQITRLMHNVFQKRVCVRLPGVVYCGGICELRG